MPGSSGTTLTSFLSKVLRLIEFEKITVNGVSGTQLAPWEQYEWSTLSGP